MKRLELEKAINESDLILSRSGYTTILDVAKLNKKAFFIPTPGQLEQEYLAKRLDEMGIVPYCAQDEFTINHFKKVIMFKGFENFKASTNISNLLSFFKGK